MDYAVVGTSERIVTAVLQGVRSIGRARCTVIGNDETRKLRWSSLCTRHEQARFAGDDDLRVTNLLNAMHRAAPGLVVIPADCNGIRLVNRIRANLDARVVPIPEPDTHALMDDKWRFHEFCSAHGIRVPQTIWIGRKEDIDFDALVARLGLPFVLKPANESGSHGVCIVTGREQYQQAVAHNAQYRFTTLIAQRYIEGEDIDASLLAIHGRLSALAIQQLRGPAIAFLDHPALERMVVQLCAASGYHGVMHVDARIERASGEVYLIESNPRFWASLTASIWCGLNFVAESMKPMPSTSSVTRLSTGMAQLRHPLLNPSAWGSMLKDGGDRGRLQRAVALDPYALGKLTGDLPQMAARYWARR